MSSVARGGATPGQTEVASLSRRNRRASRLWSIISRYSRARESLVIEACTASSCHGSPVFFASTARRGITRTRIQTFRRRSSRRSRSRCARIGPNQARWIEQSLLDVKSGGGAAPCLTSPSERPIHLGRERRPVHVVNRATALVKAKFSERQPAKLWTFLLFLPVRV